MFVQIFRISDRVLVGLTGLATDVISLDQLLQFKSNMYQFAEHRELKPETFAALLSTMLYEKRFFPAHALAANFFHDKVYRIATRFSPWFCEPVVAGLTEDNKPYISAMDLLGAPVVTEAFAVAGTCTSNLHGMCEALYRPDLVCSLLSG